MSPLLGPCNGFGVVVSAKARAAHEPIENLSWRGLWDGLLMFGERADEEEGVAGATQDRRAVDTLSEHLTLAREYALLGSYDTAFILFEGVLEQINK
ncbi:hypothetical protein KC19_7G046700 [Ceratodon purpureus]|uniref:Katanin p60 ATPase-containing subunit A1 MIT domain-containing protein n=1 Tax=Ceratodon purpureus TaxID=3225 RepID=A0A8T0H7N6_CERPU|nr:hypothetical protein KC19_7G046700 [Ceratodon purpureus]